MATTITAGNATNGGAAVSSDNTGILELKTGTGSGTTAVTIGTDQSVTFAGAVSSSGNQTVTGNLTVNGNTTLGDANTDTILMTAAPSIGGAGLGMGFGFRNRIINGAMVIDQRNAGASVTLSADTYVLDRWKGLATQASKLSVQQNAGSVTPPAGFSSYMGFTSLSAYSILTGDIFGFDQRIEGFNTYDLAWGTANAATVTLSFWVRSSLTGTFGGSLANSAATRSYPFTFSISAANTWEQKTITVAGDTTGTWVGGTNGIGMRVQFGLGVGATYSGTAGAWAGANYVSATGATSVVGTNGATFYITGVQLEKGSTATSFDYRPYGTELQLCQRYYHKPNFSDTSSSGTPYVLLQCSGSTQLLGPYMLPVTMRSTPTLTYSGFIATTANNSSAGSLTSLTLDSASTQSFRLIAGVSSGLVAGNASFIQRAATSDYMAFSAEL